MKIKTIHGKGSHLLLDGFCKEENNLDSIEKIKEFLIDLCNEINMTRLIEPVVVNYEGHPLEDENGVTGFVIIAESHISIHTYPSKDYFTLDIYSCNEFEIEPIIHFVKKELNLKKGKYKIVKRGFDEESTSD